MISRAKVTKVPARGTRKSRSAHRSRATCLFLNGSKRPAKRRFQPYQSSKHVGQRNVGFRPPIADDLGCRHRLGMRVATMLLLVLVCSACAPQPTRKTTARVISVVPRTSRIYADRLIITAQSPEGLAGSGEVNTRDLHCQVGDLVEATAQGTTLSIQGDTCSRAAKVR